MKAAVLHQTGTTPVYGDFPDPLPQGDSNVIITVKAASIKNLDRMIAKGTHYHSHAMLPAIVGVDGVGLLEDGTRVYTGGITGMMGEKALVNKKRCIPVPSGVDDVTAAALPNPALSAWFSLSYRAAIKPGDTVLIMGATGVTGKMAVQLAKYFGAGHIIAAGRNEEIMAALPALGADTLIDLKQTDEAFKAALKTITAMHPIDIVIDYLWGKPAENVLEVLTGHDLNAEPHKTRFVQVGEMAGAAISLKAATLRSSAIELYGIGGGSVPKEVMQKVPTETLPLLFQLVAEGKLKIETETVPLADIARAWEHGDTGGKRKVVVM